MKKLIFIVTILSLFLASCNAVRQSAGVNRKVIDEYSVIENPPLVIPPDFNLIPPEQLESKNIDNVDSDLAKEILFGLENDESSIEKNQTLLNVIVNQTGASEVDINIRENINQEFAGEKSTLTDETVFKNEDELNQAIIDSQKEIDVKNKDHLNKVLGSLRTSEFIETVTRI